WRRPPQSNYPPNNVLPIRELETGYRKGGISRTIPRILANPLQYLPPILHILYPVPMLSYSEGSWGLSVPLRGTGVFTDTTISPSSWLRQRPDRYTIRAGRNLPDKEFRYLRTVIVTAAVYWGFASRLHPKVAIPSYPSSTGQVSGLIHHLSISQSHMFLLNSRLGLFTAASPCGGSAPSPEVTGPFCRVP